MFAFVKFVILIFVKVTEMFAEFSGDYILYSFEYINVTMYICIQCYTLAPVNSEQPYLHEQILNTNNIIPKQTVLINNPAQCPVSIISFLFECSFNFPFYSNFRHLLVDLKSEWMNLYGMHSAPQYRPSTMRLICLIGFDNHIIVSSELFSQRPWRLHVICFATPY